MILTVKTADYFVRPLLAKAHLKWSVANWKSLLCPLCLSSVLIGFSHACGCFLLVYTNSVTEFQMNLNFKGYRNQSTLNNIPID